MKKLTLIKMGGAILTDKSKPCVIRYDLIKELTGQIRECLPFLKGSVVIGNGGGSFGHYFAEKYSLMDGITNEDGWMGFCKGKNGNAFLHTKLIEEFINQGILACSYPIDNIMNDNINKGEGINRWNQLFTYLEHGILPAVYGDIIFDSVKGCKIVYTETVFSLLNRAVILNPDWGYSIDKIIFCTNKDGIENLKGELLPFIDKTRFKQWEIFRKSGDGYDVTGGMYGKVMMAMNTEISCPVYIVNGNHPERLSGLLRGEEIIGTCIYSNV